MHARWLKVATIVVIVTLTVATAATAAGRKDGRPRGAGSDPDRGKVSPAAVTNFTDDVYITKGNTPTLRLAQDVSSGFTAQTWDVAGNEAGFFIRDSTNGSRLPLRIRPTAPSSSIDIAGSGNVGFGATAPATSLHVSTADPALRLEVKGTSNGWDLRNNGEGLFTIDNTATAAVEVKITGQGMFRVAPRRHPPKKGVAKGAMYNDTSSALCWYSGKKWLKVVGGGKCK